MGAKTISNATNAAVTLQLYVRQGDDPAHLLTVMALVLQPGQSQNVTYSDSSNPYLNGIGATSNASGNLLQDFLYVTGRGSQVDNLLNQNSRVTVGQTGLSLTITSSN